MYAAYIGLGSNLGNSIELIQSAIHALEKEGLSILLRSTIFQSKPYGGKEQPDYFNAVIGALSPFPPRQLLNLLLKVEAQMGRIRREKWESRPIDLDLILFGDWVIQEPDLQIPHPDFRNRDFVLRPLKEIGKMIIDPVTGLSVDELYNRLDTDTCTPVLIK